MNGDKVLKQQSLGGLGGKRLSDVTNSLSSPHQDEKQKLVGSCSERDYIEQLLKENVALRKVIAERKYPFYNGQVDSFTHIVVLNGNLMELFLEFKFPCDGWNRDKKMRETMQKLQQQNWHLAQANSKMLMEVNIGKDRLKAMQHELGCRNAIVKSLQLQERTENEPCQKAHTEILSLASDTAVSYFPRHSAVSEPEQTEANEEKADNKRRCLRRKSSAFKPEVPEEPTDEKAEGKEPPAEDLFEIEDAKFPVCLLLDESMKESGATSSDSTTTVKEAKKVSSAFMVETPEPRRASMGRPMRSAAVKVQSYKEIPLNIKMRRA
ncbi:hypothetical protein MKW92_025154 [Papaver armeniacum]|nr:hypothetical protein MKW92_025154 [Papaver armeniacum]